MNIAIVLAAGHSERLKGEHDLPKQFLVVNNKPVLVYSLLSLNDCTLIDQIVLVVSKKYAELTEKIVFDYKLTKVSKIIEGGMTRQESAFNALNYLKNSGINSDDLILIHDAARPLLPENVIKENIELAKRKGAVCTALKESNTIHFSSNFMEISSLIDRKSLYRAITPQTFKFSVIYNSHLNLKCNNNFTDDASIVKYSGFPVYFKIIDEDIFKITTENDLEYFKFLVSKK